MKLIFILFRVCYFYVVMFLFIIFGLFSAYLGDNYYCGFLPKIGEDYIFICS